MNREFAIRVNGRVAMTVNQRIGWDPAGGQIKSWEFDSEGGHGQGLWARLGDQWMVKATGVLQDGRTATATHVITRDDPSTCRWRTVSFSSPRGDSSGDSAVTDGPLLGRCTPTPM